MNHPINSPSRKAIIPNREFNNPKFVKKYVIAFMVSCNNDLNEELRKNKENYFMRISTRRSRSLAVSTLASVAPKGTTVKYSLGTPLSSSAETTA